MQRTWSDAVKFCGVNNGNTASVALPTLGKNAGEIFKSFFDLAFPDLYPKLELAHVRSPGRKLTRFSRQQTLVAYLRFYDGDHGFGLVVQQGFQWVANENAAVAKEMLDYIKREHAYGNKVTGKILEEHFSGMGYGWERDIVKLVLAVLLRAGSVDVTHQGRRLRNYQEPQARAAFASVPSFRSASFSPRESIGLKTLTTAVQQLKRLTGEEVDIEEGAIAARFKKLADEEMAILLPLAATVQANRLPGDDTVEQYRQALIGIQNSASDDCVRILAGEGESFIESRRIIRQMRERVEHGALELIQKARVVLAEQWPVLQRHRAGDLLQAQDLEDLITSPLFYGNTDKLAEAATAIARDYANSIQSFTRNVKRSSQTQSKRSREDQIGLSYLKTCASQCWRLWRSVRVNPSALRMVRVDVRPVIQPLASGVRHRGFEFSQGANRCARAGTNYASGSGGGAHRTRSLG